MRTNYLIAGIILLCAACSSDNESINKDTLVPVTVHVSGFDVAQEDFPSTRATPVGSYNDVNAVTLAFYNAAGTEVYKTTQLKDDASTYTTFGSFSLALPMGSYTMVAVAYTTKDESPFVLTSPTAAAYTGLHAYDTFVKKQTVTISNTDAVDISATLNRIIAQLKVVSTDGKTADVSNVRMTFSAGGKDFNPSTGWAITNTGFANTVGISASTGANSTSLSVLFLAEDNQEIDVTIETLDADGAVLFSKTVPNVPFKRNRKTILTGAMYTNPSVSGTFQVENTWLTDANVAF